MRVSTIPSGCDKQQATCGRIILVKGEATGHHHSIDADAADWWKDDKSGYQYVDVRTPTALVHQTHGAIPMDVGIYQVRQKREYTPAAIRNVRD